MVISIAMSVYNGAAYITEQLDSIKKQKRPADEVIIVDDGSIDNTVDIVCDYINANKLFTWKLFQNSKNIGYICNFRKAISLCSGDIIFTADQDDRWKETKILEIMNIFASIPETKVIGTSVSFIDGNGNGIKREYVPYNLSCSEFNNITNIPIYRIIEKNYMPGCTLAFRAEIAKEYIDSGNEYVQHDWAVELLGSIHGGLYWYSSELVDYRLHENNTVGLGKVTQNCFRYAQATIRTWKEYLKSLYHRTQFLKNAEISITAENWEHINFNEERCMAVKKRSLGAYIKNLLKNRKLLHFYDNRGIFLDILVILRFC